MCLFQREIPLKIVDRGENIKVGETTEVYVMSAIARGDYPVAGAFNVLLITWVDNARDRHSFVCCLTGSPSSRDVVQIQARKLFVDDRPKVYMRYVLFGCSLGNETYSTHVTSASPTSTRSTYVAFAEKSCDINMTTVAHKITETDNMRNKFAVCVKVAYGELFPQKLVEWFEFAKIVGVSMVQVFYHIVSEDTMAVFRYYEKTGFVILVPITPAAKKGMTPKINSGQSSSSKISCAHFPMPLLLSGILCLVKLDTFSRPLHLELL